MTHREFLLTHQELVKAVIIHRNIHEGFWRLNINFDVVATHGQLTPDPCLAVTIRAIGIMQATPDDTMAVDAARVNPAPAPRTAPQPRGGTQFAQDGYRRIAIHLDNHTPPASLVSPPTTPTPTSRE